MSRVAGRAATPAERAPPRLCIAGLPDHSISRDADHNPTHELLRRRVKRLSGSLSVNVFDSDGMLMAVRPLCHTATHDGWRDGDPRYEVSAELGFCHERDLWVATLQTGPWNARRRQLISAGARLSPVLSALHRALQHHIDNVGGGVRSEPLTVKRNPDGRLPQRLTVAALIERLDYHDAQRAGR